MRPLIVGVGNRWRGDDGVGPRAVEAIADLGCDDIDLVVLDGEPARVTSAWSGRPRVVLIDAIRTDAPAGTIHHLTDADQISQADNPSSTHGNGVAAAVALGRALGTLPERLVVLGVEPAATEHGDGLSPEVAASLGELIALAIEEVRDTCV